MPHIRDDQSAQRLLWGREKGAVSLDSRVKPDLRTVARGEDGDLSLDLRARCAPVQEKLSSLCRQNGDIAIAVGLISRRRWDPLFGLSPIDHSNIEAICKRAQRQAQQ